MQAKQRERSGNGIKKGGIFDVVTAPKQSHGPYFIAAPTSTHPTPPHLLEHPVHAAGLENVDRPVRCVPRTVAQRNVLVPEHVPGADANQRPVRNTGGDTGLQSRSV